MTFAVALTGHRPEKLAGYRMHHPFYFRLFEKLLWVIEKGLEKHDHLQLRSGLALGADTVWAQAIIAARSKHPGRIRFVAEVPVMTQPERWPNEDDKARWHQFVETADEVNIYANHYTPDCLHQRNRGMITDADMLIAVWDGSTTGGTASGVRIGEQNGVSIYRIDPKTV